MPSSTRRKPPRDRSAGCGHAARWIHTRSRSAAESLMGRPRSVATWASATGAGVSRRYRCSGRNATSRGARLKKASGERAPAAVRMGSGRAAPASRPKAAGSRRCSEAKRVTCRSVTGAGSGRGGTVCDVREVQRGGDDHGVVDGRIRGGRVASVPLDGRRLDRDASVGEGSDLEDLRIEPQSGVAKLEESFEDFPYSVVQVESRILIHRQQGSETMHCLAVLGIDRSCPRPYVRLHHVRGDPVLLPIVCCGSVGGHAQPVYGEPDGQQRVPGLTIAESVDGLAKEVPKL